MLCPTYFGSYVPEADILNTLEADAVLVATMTPRVYKAAASMNCHN